MSRCFEDVTIGESLQPFAKGPLSTTHLMRWSAAAEIWHRIHFDLPFAKDHDRLPGLLVNGSLKQQFVQIFLTEWAGASGWVWKVDLQFRAMNLAGETLRLHGSVVAKRLARDYGIVDLTIGIRNDADVESTPGTAAIALPYRDGPALPYPFEPPIFT